MARADTHWCLKNQCGKSVVYTFDRVFIDGKLYGLFQCQRCGQRYLQVNSGVFMECRIESETITTKDIQVYLENEQRL